MDLQVGENMVEIFSYRVFDFFLQIPFLLPLLSVMLPVLFSSIVDTYDIYALSTSSINITRERLFERM